MSCLLSWSGCGLGGGTGGAALRERTKIGQIDQMLMLNVALNLRIGHSWQPSWERDGEGKNRCSLV